MNRDRSGTKEAKAPGRRGASLPQLFRGLCRRLRDVFPKPRDRWEITAARLDGQSKANLARWARLILTQEDEHPRTPVLVSLLEEERQVRTTLDDVAQGRWPAP